MGRIPILNYMARYTIINDSQPACWLSTPPENTCNSPISWCWKGSACAWKGSNSGWSLGAPLSESVYDMVTTTQFINPESELQKKKSLTVALSQTDLNQSDQSLSDICVRWLETVLTAGGADPRMLVSEKNSPNYIPFHGTHCHIIQPWRSWHVMHVNWNVTSHDPTWNTNLSRYSVLHTTAFSTNAAL